MLRRPVESTYFKSSDYQKFLMRNTLICSMSAVGYYVDNAACEGLFGMLKRERVHREIYLLWT